MSIVRLHSNRKSMPDWLEIGVLAHTGGEGSIFFSRDGRYAIKIYLRQRPEKRQLLEKIMLLGANLTVEESQFLCWPLALVENVDGSERVGCMTQRIPTPPYTVLENVMLTPKQSVEQFRAGKSCAN